MVRLMWDRDIRVAKSNLGVHLLVQFKLETYLYSLGQRGATPMILG